MIIAGGCYLEHCDEPYWHELYGSGVRAAACIGALTKDVKLITYACKDDLSSLAATASTFGFEVESTHINHRTSFHYTHGLCTPLITPHPLQIERPASLLVNTGDILLRFGFIEGDAIVHSDSVVYDPQSAYAPRPFWENGSTAKRLAIVANRAEAKALTGCDNEDEMLKSLLTGKNVEVVIIKLGPSGALVATQSDRVTIPAYETDFVWPIGSGDVFSTFFTYYWAEKAIAPANAADKASKAAAYYCNSGALPIPVEFETTFNFPPVGRRTLLSDKTIYLAGPFFTMAQRWLIRESLVHLRTPGISVFSPFHEVGIGTAQEVYTPDIVGLEKSSVVFACLDGLDSGTLFEIG